MGCLEDGRIILKKVFEKEWAKAWTLFGYIGREGNDEGL
jgi:hypothetical protein